MKTNLCKILSILFLIMSCSNGDSSNNEDQENPIIGSWQPVQAIFIDENGVQDIEIYDECQLMGNIDFYVDGIFEQSGFYLNSGVCEIEFDNTGNWVIINENILRVTLNGQVDNGAIGDYLILELTDSMLRIDADLDPESIEQEVYIFIK